MDRRLWEASKTGNTQLLRQLLEENPFILHTIDPSSADNPLLVALIAGGDDHVDFVKEILMLKYDFSKQFNQDGFSPIHLASANGYFEIVRELLKVDRELCRLGGRNNWSPLHFAASRGKLEIIREILLVCPESIDDVNVQKETALHIAVKNSQFEAISVMVEFIKNVSKDNVLNLKDECGNSALHLATWRKQRQVIELLIRNRTAPSDTLLLEMNAVNQSGLTPLDILLIFPSEAGDREIEGILRNAGAMRARDTSLCPSSSFQNENHDENGRNTESETADNLTEYFKFKKGRDSPSDVRDSLLVMAVLVATATFQAGINPPCGIWQNSNFNGNNNEPIHKAGDSILGSYSSLAYSFFVVFNSLGFSLSLYMLRVLTRDFPLKFEFELCVTALYFTYNTSIITMVEGNTRVFIIVLAALLPNTIYYLVKKLRQIMEKLMVVLATVINFFRCKILSLLI